jgi:SNF2 family DNA or RNA helicase
VEANNHRVTVRFDGETESKVFSTTAGVLRRIDVSGTVRRVSTGAIGFVHAASSTSPPRWQVILDGKLVTVAEADLRPHVLHDPQTKLIEGRLGSPRQLALALTARRYELEHLTNDLVSLGESRVDIKPHQVSVVHRVISDYPHRFLLCDEVGLGKTIEAGLILKELRARGGAERVLVIAPPNLVRQWQFELKSKFNETFSILNTATVRYLMETQGLDGNPFRQFDSVIVSSAWLSGDKWSQLAAEVDWDMVIVDEAHHARVHSSGKRTTRLYRVVRDLVSPDAFSKRSALFLTATPMQLDSGELYSLIELLDPALFPTEKHFDLHRSLLPGLSRLVHELSIQGYPLPDAEDDDVVERVASWLDIEEEVAIQRLEGGPDEIAKLCDELAARHLLSEVLIRNRKKIVGGFMPRQAFRWEVELTDAERVALEAVESYVRDGYAKADRTNDTAVGFVMVIFQKLMASSIRALRTSLNKRYERLASRSTSASGTKSIKKRIEQLEARLEDDEDVSELLAELAEADSEEAAELKRLVELLDAVPVDSKAETLVRQLAELRELEPDAKVLLFTEFRETQEYLRERLNEIGWDVHMFHGQMKPEAKDASVDAFRESSAASILLSTEAGGEGRNFQFCHLLVNYDLPWNPMRVEQRIGRVDRIGQDHTVQVFNFWVKGTVEERVLDVLERRINIFEDTVGGLDPILGDAERDLKKILRLGGDERERALVRFEEQIEKKISQARLAEEKLRDFIMETKSYSHEIATLLMEQATPIGPADLELFVNRLLGDVNTYISAQPDGTYEIMFHEPFVSEYPQHVKDQLRKRQVALRPDVKPDSQHVEYMALGHPVVDDLIGRVTSSDYPGSAAAIEIEADEGLPATTGWFVVHELGVPALKEVRELWPTFVHVDGRVDRELGQLLLTRAAKFPHDRSLAPDDVPADSLDDALQAAEHEGFAHLGELEAAATTDNARRVDREREKLTAYFDYRDQAAADRLASSQKTLATLELSESTEQRRIIPVWKANVARDEQLVEQLQTERVERLQLLEQQIYGGGDLRLVAAAWVEIRSEHDE